jgi:serine-type D-Ala-D-Ala carboxypeptidase (penicillin-binding protein 5/6)
MQLAPQNIMTTVTRNAAGYSGTTASLKSGFVLSLLDLFYGMMLPSGNDAAVSVAELVGGMLLSER